MPTNLQTVPRTPVPGGESAGPSSERAPLGARDLVLILGFWTFVGALSAASRLLDPRVPGMQPTVVSALVRLEFLEYYLWAALTVPIFWLSSRIGGELRPRLGRLLLLVALGIVVAVAVDAVLVAARSRLLPSQRARPLVERVLEGLGRERPETGRGPRGRGPRGPVPFYFVDDFMVYLGVLAAGMARGYFLRYQARREESAQLHAHAARLEAQLAQARLDVLRGQLNPHFLFNTLNAVSALVERDPRGVRRMIARLSELLRHALDDEVGQEIPLDRELELLDRYVEIMRIRFRDHLDVRIDVDAPLRSALVPNLILQPLVENAVEHGASRRTQGVVVVSARRAGGDLVLRVADNGPGPSPLAAESTGVGLRNTRARLEELYGDAQRFTLGAGAEGGAVAEVVLPYHTRDDVRAGVEPAAGAARHG